MATKRDGRGQDTPDQEGRVFIQLDAKDEGGSVTVTPRDQDRFILLVEEAIEACKEAAKDKQAKRRFMLLLNRLQRWLLTRLDVADAYLTDRDGGLFFVVVRKVATYDDGFEDELSELDREIAT